MTCWTRKSLLTGDVMKKAKFEDTSATFNGVGEKAFFEAGKEISEAERLEIEKYAEALETGLVVPEGISESDFFKLGSILGKADSALQWWRGDWYNKIPKKHSGVAYTDEAVGKKAACNRAGINYKTAEHNGYVCRMFPIPVRTGILYFYHYHIVARHSSTPLLNTQGARLEWLQKAIDGDQDGPWSAQRLKREIKAELGLGNDKPLKQTLDEMKADILEQLPARTSERVKQLLAGFLNRAMEESDAAIRAAVSKAVKKQTQIVEEKAQSLLSREKLVDKWEQGVKAFVTYEEYKLILGCLHPDRAPEDLKPRFNEAFDIWRKLLDNVGSLNDAQKRIYHWEGYEYRPSKKK